MSFAAPGFVSATRVFPAALREKNVIVIWPRAKPVTVDAAAGGRVAFANGGSVTLPPGALVDERGRPIAGPAAVSATYFDPSDPAQLRAISGDFAARMRDGSERRLESFGVVDIFVADRAGRRLKLAEGRTAKVQIPVPRRFLERAPARVRSFSFEPANGYWMEEGMLVLDGSAYTGTISQLDSWNADDPFDTTCMTFEVIRWWDNQPQPNCVVEAEGVTYGSISTGTTDANGRVCLLVKLNAQVKVMAFGCAGHPTYQSEEQILTSPNTIGGAANCADGSCTSFKINLDNITSGGG